MNREELYTQFDHVFFEKTRLSVITLLYSEETVCFNRLKKMLGGTDGALYSHLKKLIDAGYILNRKTVVNNTAQTNYSLTRSGKELFKKYLRFLEGIVMKEDRGGRE